MFVPDSSSVIYGNIFLRLGLESDSYLNKPSVSIYVAEESFVDDLVYANDAYGSGLTVGSLVAERV